jgi:hypothetical protein
MINPDKNKRGRPKGSTGSHFVKIKLSDLTGYLGHNAGVVVSKKWLNEMGIYVEDVPKKFLTPMIEEPKIQFNITD